MHTDFCIDNLMMTKTDSQVKIPTVEVLDIPLFDGSIPDAYSIFMNQIESGEKNSYCISAADANVLINSKKDPEFRNILLQAYINLPDGMPGVWVGKLKGAKKIDRCYGPDFFEYMLRHTADKKVNHYFTGGKEGIAEALKEACKVKFGNDNVVGTHCPPFREVSDEEFEALGKDITEKQADIVWVGISSPKQERYARRLSKYARTHFIVTVGAAFDFHTGNVKQAPRFIQRSGMEWLFRLCVEPRRLWKRYVNVVPKFIYYNLLSFTKFRKQLSSH